MENEIETIQYINIGYGKNHPIDAVLLNGKKSDEIQINRLVTSIDDTSDNTHYPSAKCMWDIIGDLIGDDKKTKTWSSSNIWSGNEIW